MSNRLSRHLPQNRSEWDLPDVITALTASYLTAYEIVEFERVCRGVHHAARGLFTAPRPLSDPADVWRPSFCFTPWRKYFGWNLSAWWKYPDYTLISMCLHCLKHGAVDLATSLELTVGGVSLYLTFTLQPYDENKFYAVSFITCDNKPDDKDVQMIEFSLENYLPTAQEFFDRILRKFVSQITTEHKGACVRHVSDRLRIQINHIRMNHPAVFLAARLHERGNCYAHNPLKVQRVFLPDMGPGWFNLKITLTPHPRGDGLAQLISRFRH